jgi:hypothetical protein
MLSLNMIPGSYELQAADVIGSDLSQFGNVAGCQQITPGELDWEGRVGSHDVPASLYVIRA